VLFGGHLFVLVAAGALHKGRIRVLTAPQQSRRHHTVFAELVDRNHLGDTIHVCPFGKSLLDCDVSDDPVLVLGEPHCVDGT
jgi:hypothetical protein